jgi:hypothetical protein
MMSNAYWRGGTVPSPSTGTVTTPHRIPGSRLLQTNTVRTLGEGMIRDRAIRDFVTWKALQHLGCRCRKSILNR